MTIPINSLKYQVLETLLKNPNICMLEQNLILHCIVFIHAGNTKKEELLECFKGHKHYNIINILLSNEKLIPLKGWISVKDKLPPLEQRTLIFSDGLIYVAEYWGENSSSVEGNDWYTGEFFTNATHWMPLPATPNGE